MSKMKEYKMEEYELHSKNGKMLIQCFYNGDKLTGCYKLWWYNGDICEYSYYRNNKKVCDLNDSIIQAYS